MSRSTHNDRRKNNHHLVWIARAQTGLRLQVRNLPCCQVMLDIEVHKVLHKIYLPPKLMTDEDARHLLNRHATGACACFSPLSVRVNILEINDPGKGD